MKVATLQLDALLKAMQAKLEGPTVSPRVLYNWCLTLIPTLRNSRIQYVRAWNALLAEREMTAHLSAQIQALEAVIGEFCEEHDKKVSGTRLLQTCACELCLRAGAITT